MAEVQSVGPVGGSKHTLQISAMNIAKGRPEPFSIGIAQGDRKRRDATVVTPAPPNKFGWFCRKSRYRLQTAETLKLAASVRAQGYSRTDFF
jgi:hypothetical protein